MMKLLIVVILLLSVTLSGCYTMRTYTFKKDRVDQKAEGNRGYIMGTPPPAPLMSEVPKRTMVGIDIELGLLPGEKARVDFGKSGVSVIEEKEEQVIRVAEEKAVEEEQRVEEEWIK